MNRNLAVAPGLDSDFNRFRYPAGDDAAAALFARFENLGDNCEFGLVQRGAGLTFGLLHGQDVFTVASMQAILNDVQNALDQGGKVYLHCRAGIGRTGTVAATWLVSQGLTPEQALALLAQKWRAVDKHAHEPLSPETVSQHEFVLNWPHPH